MFNPEKMLPPVAASRILRWSLKYQRVPLLPSLPEVQGTRQHRRHELPATTYVILQCYQVPYGHCTLGGPAAGTSLHGGRLTKSNTPGPGTGTSHHLLEIRKLA